MEGKKRKVFEKIEHETQLKNATAETGECGEMNLTYRNDKLFRIFESFCSFPKLFPIYCHKIL